MTGTRFALVTWGITVLAMTACASGGGRTGAAGAPAVLSSNAAQGDLEQAWTHFLGASGAAVAHFNLGIAHLAGRRYDAAVREFQAAYRIDPSFDAAYERARHARMLAHGPPGGR